MVDRALVHLKDGDSRPIVMPPDGSTAMRTLLLALSSPDQVKGQTLTLNAPENARVDLKTSDIASLEIPPPYFVVHDFLSPSEADQVSEHIISRAGQFEDATISLYTNQHASTPVPRLRRSRVLNAVGEVMPLFVPKLHKIAPRFTADLRMPVMPLSKIECQITAHGDGDFFNTHIDNGLPDIAHRRISYVYYIHREPKPFRGGILRFYNTLLENRANNCGRHASDYDPARNSLIVFPSHCHHEVTPISAESSALADQRLTVNGWLCI
jgi:Rps23 Pro-64 3,4-dihydroxylase Tpa1-like proline 4-hydroxylase